MRMGTKRPSREVETVQTSINCYSAVASSTPSTPFNDAAPTQLRRTEPQTELSNVKVRLSSQSVRVVV